MFQNYEIKKVKNEEVLVLYVDFSVEFAKSSIQKKTTLNKEVSKFIHDKKIKFNGKKIILMAGSVILGALLITSEPEQENYSSPMYQYSTNIITLKEPVTPQFESVIEEKKEDTTAESVKPTNPIPDTSSSTNKPATNKKPTITKPSTSNPTNTPTPSVSNNTTPNTPKEPDPVVLQKEMVTIHRSNGAILNLELEEYLIGVVAAEMPASFHIEALKAQAVAARTYALKAKQNGQVLTDTVSTQVYKDNNQLKAMWGSGFQTYYNKVKQAVYSTSGYVMTYQGSFIQAYYHSTSNGYTEDSTAVFGAYPYLKSVDSLVDKNVSSYLKTITLSYEDISQKLGIPVTSLSNIVIEKNQSNRNNHVIIDDHFFDGVLFRTKLGLRSTDFDITLSPEEVSITTRGYGHGVGMSQYGANEYAKKGWSYQNILKHYYTGITISKY